MHDTWSWAVRALTRCVLSLPKHFLIGYMKSRSSVSETVKTVRVQVGSSSCGKMAGVHRPSWSSELLPTFLAGNPLLCSGTGKPGSSAGSTRPLRSHILRREVRGAPDFSVLGCAHEAPRASDFRYLDGRSPSGISTSEIF